MIEKKFKESIKLFRHDVFISEDNKYVVANPHIFVQCTNRIDILEYFEKKGYNFLFSSEGALYFKERKKK